MHRQVVWKVAESGYESCTWDASFDRFLRRECRGGGPRVASGGRAQGGARAGGGRTAAAEVVGLGVGLELEFGFLLGLEVLLSSFFFLLGIGIVDVVYDAVVAVTKLMTRQRRRFTGTFTKSLPLDTSQVMAQNWVPK